MFLNLEAYKKLKRSEFTPKQYFPLITIVQQVMNALQITVLEIKVLPLFDIRIQPIHLPRKIKMSINCLINNEMIAYKSFLVMMSCSLFVFLCSIDIIDDSALNFLIIIIYYYWRQWQSGACPDGTMYNVCVCDVQDFHGRKNTLALWSGKDNCVLEEYHEIIGHVNTS